MRASLDSRWFLLGLAASLTLAGCGNGSDQGSPSPPYPLYDTGVIRAVKVDAAVEHALDGAGEANPAVDGASLTAQTPALRAGMRREMLSMQHPWRRRSP